jgi:hypothetical protein
MSFSYTNEQTYKADPLRYLADRYSFILLLEESGVAKLTPYNDGDGWVTIGVGYNLSDSNVRGQVLSAMGITDASLINELNNYLSKNYKGVSDSTIKAQLDSIMGKYIPGGTFGFASDIQVQEVFNGTSGNNAVTGSE